MTYRLVPPEELTLGDVQEPWGQFGQFEVRQFEGQFEEGGRGPGVRGGEQTAEDVVVGEGIDGVEGVAADQRPAAERAGTVVKEGGGVVQGRDGRLRERALVGGQMARQLRGVP